MWLAWRATFFFNRPLLLSTLALIGILTATPATAQLTDPPIGPFVVDLRGSFARYGQDETLAKNVGVVPGDLPARGLGLDVGGHVYFLRWRAITFGAGGSLQWTGGTHQTQADPMKNIKAGPRVQTQLRTIVPNLSFNFGTGRGWSYLSGGISPVRLKITRDDKEQFTRSTKTINYGGGARWFAKPHLAFTFDLRFYAMSPLAQDEAFIGLPRLTLMVFSAGVALK